MTGQLTDRTVPSHPHASRVYRMAPPWGHPPGQGRLHELAGDLLHAFFASAIIADFAADHEAHGPDQVVVVLSREASGMTSEMPTDAG